MKANELCTKKYQMIAESEARHCGRRRALWSIFQPGELYNDRLLCLTNNNKNSNTNSNIDSLNEINDYEAASMLQAISKLINKNGDILGKYQRDDQLIFLFPNPCNQYVNVNYKCENDGALIIMNNVGQLVQKVRLNKGPQHTEKVLLPELSEGVYVYKIILDKQVYTGKLNITKE